MTPPAAIQVDRLTWEVGRRAIVNDVSFEVAAGEILGVVGPNGSGKSSLVRCISGDLRPSRGDVRFHGRPASSYARRELARTLAVVMQHHTVDAGVTAAQVIELGRLPHRRLLESASAAEAELLARCARTTGVTELLSAPFRQLSGGERQRVVLARALAQQPSILMLDEPTNHLDLHYQVELVDLIRDLGLPTLVVLHDLTLAARLCDRLVVLNRGRVQATGAATEVITRDLLTEVWQVVADIVADGDGNPIVVARRTATATTLSDRG